MVNTTRCPQCAQSGLPILFTRYAAAYSSTTVGMAALDSLKLSAPLQVTPGNVRMQTAKYNLRMLRAGYLYIRLESVCRLPEWLGFVVHPHGYLTRIDIHHPEKTTAEPACRPNEWGANRSLVWIKDAVNVSGLQFMFRPDPIDHEHLKGVIDKDPGKYMQSFDVVGWFKGVKAGPDTVAPGADMSSWNVAEFKALKDETLRNALEPQLYGLMGSNATERGWGDYESKRFVETDHYLITGEHAGKITVEEISAVKQLDYAGAHGKRLEGIAELLAGNGGAIVACEDAIGIAQELGHLLSEAQIDYLRWEQQDAHGAAKGVSNEWMYQTAISARTLKKLIKDGAVRRTNKRIAQWDKMLSQQALDDVALVLRNPAVSTRSAATREIARANQQREREAASIAGDKAYDELFDQAGAEKIIEAQHAAYEKNFKRLSLLGLDHTGWLKAPSLMKAGRRYSTEAHVIDRPGGGTELTIQFAQCMAGTESNSTGQDWIKQTDLFGNNPLGCAIGFNNMKLQRALQKMFESTLPAGLPQAEPSSERMEILVDLALKPLAAHLALADKAIAFAADDKLKPISQSALMRRMAWPLHLASLFSVKMLQALKNGAAFEAEAKLVKFVALTGFLSMGRTAAAYAQTLKQADIDRLRNATRAIEKAGRRDGMALALAGAPHARAAAMSGVFDIANVVIKAGQLSVKKDSRTGVEMVGSLMQATGTMLDWRARAYEVTVFEGATGASIFAATSQHAVSDGVNALRLRGMQRTAFRFLLPAAMVGMFWDATDALQSHERKNYALEAAQWASVAGATFSIAATGMVATGALFGISAATWAMTACILGLVGAVVTVAAVAAIIFLKDEEWVDWLKDNPLNIKRRGKKPVHESLKETLQKLANAEASAA
jgi:hypothetical protein